MPLHDLAELHARLGKPLLLELCLAQLVELLGGQDRRRRRPEPRAAAGDEKEKEGEGAKHRPEDIAYFKSQKSFDFARLARYYHSGFAAGRVCPGRSQMIALPARG